MKLNNKGITLVETIVTFALLMVILVGLFNIILDVKSDVSDRQIIKDLKDYENIMLSKLQGDFITKGVSGCNISGKSATCTYKNGTKTITIGETSITYDNVEYPVPNSDILAFDTNNRIEITNGNIVVIFKYHIIGETKDYGFEIIHPLSL